MRRRDHLARYVAIGVVFVLVALVYVIKLFNLQIAGQDHYETGQSIVYTERRVSLYALRGEIYDTNGKPLVTNVYSYDVCFEAGGFPKSDSEANALVLGTLEKGRAAGVELIEPEPLIVWNDGGWSYNTDFASGKGRRLAKLLYELELWLSDDYTDAEHGAPEAKVAGEGLLEYYGLGEFDDDGNFSLTDYGREDAMDVLTYRLDMFFSDFSQACPYTVMKDVDVNLITSLREGSVKGIITRTEAQRKYEYPGAASHILGRTGKIQADDAQYYTEQGYPLDAIVGTSGAELAFENFLHGTNGTMVIVEDNMGNVVETRIEKEPIPGKDVYLTLDIDLQMMAEESLAANVQYIVAKSDPDKPLSGEDADAGALAVMKVKTGDVLALATYPTYDLTTFSEDYAKLRDDPLTPMLNRALVGQYTPGSTFKPGVAVAALNEGIITPYTTINDTGVYKYYSDAGFEPRCWINLLYGGAHGPLNVTGAIQVSCNYFFYDVGRLLTINKMNEYCRAYGLGQNTGIELAESKGILAGPDYRAEASLGAWSPGDTVQAAIGQIENSFTPLQLSVYISTILNEGDRVAAHILKEVREYGAAEPSYVKERTVLSHKDLSHDAVSVVKNAMRDVTEDNGSAARLFENYPLQIGSKTGTAQVKATQSDNAVFVAFAPFDDPEIAATCAIEKGAGGTDAGYSVRDVFSYVFKVDYKDGFDAFKEDLRNRPKDEPKDDNE